MVDNGEDALALATKNPYDLFVLDIMLPRYGRLRAVPPPSLENPPCPSCFCRHAIPNSTKLSAWKSAATTIWRSPSASRRAQLRACGHCCAAVSGGDFPGANHAVTASGITLDEDAHTASGQNGEIDLTPREFELLASLMKNAGKVVSREDLLRDAWGWEILDGNKDRSTPTSNVSVIRLSPPGTIPAWWRRSRGYGYRFRQ